MRKVVIIIIASVAILSIEFFVGYIMGKNNQLVTVKIKNHSNHTIANATIEYFQGDRTVIDIPKNRSKVARFYSGEKSIYRLKVVLDNEKTLFSASRFVSPGCMLIERVCDTLVTSER
jgi:hypothetical protein